MDQAEEYFEYLKEWSARKLAIITKYVGAFSKILGGRNNELFYIDGFAGKGTYGKGEKGSPVLAAEFSLTLQDGKKPYTLRCINVENDHENYNDLSTETKRFGNLVTNLEGTFEENTDQILEKIANVPAIFFLDPFGPKGIGWRTLEKIISRTGQTDLWIRFDHKTILRLMGFLESETNEASQKLSIVQNTYGIADIKYLKSRLDGATAEERVANAINLYLEQLEGAFGNGSKKGFAAAYTIRSIEGERKYSLVFACAHPTAATLASNIANGIEQEYQHDRNELHQQLSGQMSLFPSEITEKQKFEDEVAMVQQYILSLPKHKTMTRVELHYAILVQDKTRFGQFGRTHFTTALKRLIESEPSHIKADGTPGNDKSTFTLL